MLASLPQNNKALRFISVDANMITVSFIQAVDVLFISSDNFKGWWEKVNGKNKRMKKNKVRLENNDKDTMVWRCDCVMVKW